MKKNMLLVLVAILYASFAFAQTATINFNIKNATLSTCRLFYQTGVLSSRDKTISVPIDDKGQAVYNLKITTPKFISFSCYDSKSKKSLNYSLFVSPGDQLYFDADMFKPENQVTITGKGGNNNQPLPGNWIYFSGDYYGDTIPTRAISAILKEEKALRVTLEKYIALNKPSDDFIRIQSANLDYWAVNAYFGFKENNKYQIEKAYKRNFAKWQAVQDSLLKMHPLDNPKSLSAPTYTSFIAMFVLREKERLWNQQRENATEFYKEWYGGDQLKGEQEYTADVSNSLREKIINKYFKDKTAEYLYAYLINNSIEEGNPKNLKSIYNNFKSKYINSEFYPVLTSMMAEVSKKQQQNLTDRMVFIDSAATPLNTFNDLLKLAKNKTVLVDMWGTWCTPCRQEIEAHSAEIKKHFKDKDLQYFYVANYDARNVKAWKELVAYFHLEGTHILANEKLTTDIMKSVKGSGFPTYFVIKKDGSFELSKAGYPMNRKKMIEQLEASINLPN